MKDLSYTDLKQSILNAENIWKGGSNFKEDLQGLSLEELETLKSDMRPRGLGWIPFLSDMKKVMKYSVVCDAIRGYGQE